MLKEKITAFPDGNSFVRYNSSIDKLIIGNSEGLVKIFNSNEPDLEPTSVDITENLTSLSHHSDKLLVTNINGNLELVDLTSSGLKGSIYRSELPLRDSMFINEGKRILCGGDDNKLILIDLLNSNTVSSVSIPDQLLNLSYNYSGEILSVSLSNGNIQLYSVINEIPSLIETIPHILPNKIHTSMDIINYNEDHKDELISTKTQWSSSGEFLLIPTVTNSIKVYKRSNWTESVKEFKLKESEINIIDFQLSSNDKHLAVLYFDLSVKIFDFKSTNIDKEMSIDLDGNYPINLAWRENDLYVGTTLGEIIHIKDIIDNTTNNTTNELFLEEADESEDEGNNTDKLLNDSEAEEEATAKNIDKLSSDDIRLHEEDSMVIDQDEDGSDYFNRDNNTYFDDRQSRKRHRPNGNGFMSSRPYYSITDLNREAKLTPYSPGSTPWSNKDKSLSKVDRRYLFMNSIGYVWSVKNLSNEDCINQQSITVSFFDRSVNKDYHFIDSDRYDLCSINEKGVLLGVSGDEDAKDYNNGKIYYRSHSETQDAWERTIPLLKNEFITSISITNNSKYVSDNNAKIIIGTNFGYVRFFNLFGVCINLIKTTPVVTLISSSNSVMFMVNQVSSNVYSYSIIDVNDDYKFIQQDILLPLKKSIDNPDLPLIKGLFFNEYNDPCLVPGIDDTLLVLQSWRETNNSKWIPILNCKNIVTEYGTNENKKNWKCWPLGLYKDQLNCLILKNNDQYPGFPLPLPIELGIKLPILIPNKPGHGNNEALEQGNNETQSNPIDEEDPEEIFLRSLTMGKLVSDSLNDDFNEEENDEIMERLQGYSVSFDKSLLKIFGNACKDYKLKKAFSIAKLIKTDKALFAASKICERMDLPSLANKISKLREDLINLSDED